MLKILIFTKDRVDALVPKNETDKSGSGIGLKNLSRQLELLYPGKYNLHAESDSHIYRSMLTIDLN